MAANNAMAGPFRWWYSDCCTSACRAFDDLHGVDVLSGYPEYNDIRGAALFLKEYGGRDGCPEFIADRNGLIECGPIAGAICAAWVTPRRWALGICVGGGYSAFKSDNGMTIKRDIQAKYWTTECHQ